MRISSSEVHDPFSLDLWPALQDKALKQLAADIKADCIPHNVHTPALGGGGRLARCGCVSVYNLQTCLVTQFSSCLVRRILDERCRLRLPRKHPAYSCYLTLLQAQHEETLNILWRLGSKMSAFAQWRADCQARSGALWSARCCLNSSQLRGVPTKRQLLSAPNAFKNHATLP